MFPNRRWAFAAAALVLLLVLAVACATTSNEGVERGAGVDLEAERAALLKADAEFSKVAAERGLEGFLSFVAEDATFFSGGARMLEGKEAIGPAWAPLLTTPGLAIRWEPTRAEVSQAGDLGYTIGRFEITRSNEESKDVVQRGIYVTIWRKQADGSWKAVVDIGNPEEPPAGSPVGGDS
jgi:ketosteroid isomerase-like protein